MAVSPWLPSSLTRPSFPPADLWYLASSFLSLPSPPLVFASCFHLSHSVGTRGRRFSTLEVRVVE